MLLYIPVLHAGPDLGSLAGPVAQAYRRRYGPRGWEAHARSIRELWRGIAERIEALPLDFPRVKLYQDGLPVCGREEEIVRDLSRAGSPNHRLLVRLLGRGATLVGTESPELLLGEYRSIQDQLQGDRAGADLEGARRRIDERDRFIARRIEETLGEAETGLLFIGLAHEVDRHLDPRIRVKFLIHRLPFEEGREGHELG